MQNLNLPTYPLKIAEIGEKQYQIYDVIRKKLVVLTPEEWVRQHIIHYLLEEKKYPKTLMAVEKEIKVNNLKKRFDILIFNKEGQPNIIVECKAPTIKITQDTFDQIARYNLKLEAKYLMVTNGMEHYYCMMDTLNKRYIFLEDIPNYN